MDTLNIPQDKVWAVELSEVDFSHEFQRRFPIADFIPNKSDWLGMPEPINRMIDGVRPDDMLADEYQTPKKYEETPVINEKKIKEYTCRGEGCDRTFTAFIGRIAHERKCLKALNTKIG